jgi:D-3-phosphoglycerate dehydrogenase / 2-oxoglutarate reductase
MPRIFTPDGLADEGMEILRRTPGFEIDSRSGLKGDDLKAALAECDAVIVRSGTTLNADLLQGLTKLKAVVRAGVGVDNIEVGAATRQGVVVMNTPGGNTLSTAEHTWALLLSLCRRVPAADASLRAGKWDRKSFVGRQLAGKTLGVVGLGRIGREVAKRARAFDMHVIGYDPLVSAERAAEEGIETVATVAEMIPRVDVLTVHVPMSADTKGLIGAKEFERMRPGAMVVNCARGGIVDEGALHEALVAKKIAGAALDVYESEPNTSSPLFQLPNVVVTPHLGASTTEAQINVSIEAAQLLVEYFQTGVVKCAVNMASVDATELADVRRFLDIAYRLGLLQSQVHPTVRKATIEYRGEVSKKNTRLVTAAFTMGLLQRNIPDVNLVSARQLAEDRGVRIEERSSSEPSDFAALVQTIVESNAGSYMAAGTTRGASFNRLVRLGPFRLDSYLEGCLLILEHHDQPGIIARTSAILANDKVNIAQMVVGRQRQGGEAVGVLALDSAPSEAAMKELSRMQDEGLVSNLRVVQLPAAGVLPPGVG